MNWLLKQARIPNKEGLHSLLLQDGKIALNPDHVRISNAQVWDLAGRTVLPGLADMHVHLDKTYSDFTNISGTLWGAIESFRVTIATRTEQQIYDRAERALKTAVSAGVTRMRSHVNLGSKADLELFRILSALRDRYQLAVELQLVGMVSINLLQNEPDVVNQAQALGLDLIGGAPALEEDPSGAVTKLVSAAVDRQLPIDLHIDETEDPKSVTLLALAEAVSQQNVQLPVTAGHCCSLAFMSEAQQANILSRVSDAGLTLVTLPMCNLMLMGREMHPSPRGVAPARAIIDQGIDLCAASDNVHDPFNPFGNYDPLSAMQLTVLAGQLTDQATLSRAYDLVTLNADRHFSSGGAIADGEPADLTVLDETDPVAGVVNPPRRLATFKAGRQVFRSKTQETWDI